MSRDKARGNKSKTSPSNLSNTYEDEDEGTDEESVGARSQLSSNGSKLENLQEEPTEEERISERGSLGDMREREGSEVPSLTNSAVGRKEGSGESSREIDQSSNNQESPSANLRKSVHQEQSNSRDVASTSEVENNGLQSNAPSKSIKEKTSQRVSMNDNPEGSQVPSSTNSARGRKEGSGESSREIDQSSNNQEIPSVNVLKSAHQANSKDVPSTFEVDNSVLKSNVPSKNITERISQRGSMNDRTVGSKIPSLTNSARGRKEGSGESSRGIDQSSNNQEIPSVNVLKSARQSNSKDVPSTSEVENSVLPSNAPSKNVTERISQRGSMNDRPEGSQVPSLTNSALGRKDGSSKSSRRIDQSSNNQENPSANLQKSARQSKSKDVPSMSEVENNDLQSNVPSKNIEEKTSPQAIDDMQDGSQVPSLTNSALVGRKSGTSSRRIDQSSNNQENPSANLLKSAHQSNSRDVHSTSEVKNSVLQSNAPSKNINAASYQPSEGLANRREGASEYDEPEISPDDVVSKNQADRDEMPDDEQPQNQNSFVISKTHGSNGSKLESRYEQLMGEERTSQRGSLDDMPEGNEIPSSTNSVLGRKEESGESSRRIDQQSSNNQEIPSVNVLKSAYQSNSRDVPSTSEVENTVLQSNVPSQNINAASYQPSGGLSNRREDGSEYDGYEISPEDIFSEIKVARNENPEAEHPHNLHNKTIAQGLKPETYGGVVSIDQYDFDNQQNPQGSQGSQKPSEQEKSAVKSQKQRLSEIPEEGGQLDSDNSNKKNIGDILKRLEDYVAQVNKDIKEARDIVNKAPMCRNDATTADAVCCSPCEEEVSNFDELPFVDKIVKMFHVVMEEDEPCNLCDKSKMNVNSNRSGDPDPAVSNWLQSLMKEICKFCPNMPRNNNDLKASAAAIIAMQSQAILDEVRKSGLLNNLSKTGLQNLQQGDDSNMQSRPPSSAPGPSRSVKSTGGSSGYEADGELSSNEIAKANKQRKMQKNHPTGEKNGRGRNSNEANDDTAQDDSRSKRRYT